MTDSVVDNPAPVDSMINPERIKMLEEANRNGEPEPEPSPPSTPRITGANTLSVGGRASRLVSFKQEGQTQQPVAGGTWPSAGLRRTPAQHNARVPGSHRRPAAPISLPSKRQRSPSEEGEIGDCPRHVRPLRNQHPSIRNQQRVDISKKNKKNKKTISKHQEAQSQQAQKKEAVIKSLLQAVPALPPRE